MSNYMIIAVRYNEVLAVTSFAIAIAFVHKKSLAMCSRNHCTVSHVVCIIFLIEAPTKLFNWNHRESVRLQAELTRKGHVTALI